MWKFQTKMNLRRDNWLAGALLFLSCTSVVRTQRQIPGASDIGLFTGLSNIASFGLGTLMGFFVKPCPACSDVAAQNETDLRPTEPTSSLACPDSFTTITAGNSTRCYIYPNRLKDREEASRDCADRAPKNAHGQLLGIETEEESEAVLNYLIDNDSGGAELWVAATDYNQDGTYIWDKNGAIVPNVDGKPEKCVVLVDEGDSITFVGANCITTNSYRYICESDQVLQS